MMAAAEQGSRQQGARVEVEVGPSGLALDRPAWDLGTVAITFVCRAVGWVESTTFAKRRSIVLYYKCTNASRQRQHTA